MEIDAQQPEDRDGFRFRGGHAALDLTATLAARLKSAPRELLATPEDLSRWLRSAGLGEVMAEAADLALAHELREAVYVLGVAVVAGQGLPDAARLTLNAVAGRAAAVPMLDERGRAGVHGTAAGLLALLAREAVELLGGPARERLRQCDAAACTLLFLDASRGGERRWCSMKGCGNKAKVAEFRRRRRAAAAP